MTMAGGGGGTGMTSGDDFVAARLSVDVPEGSTAAIREITTEVEHFRTALEAAAHAEGNVNTLLTNMASAARQAAEAQVNLTQQLQTYMALTARGGISQSPVSSGVPTGGFLQPFAAGEAGMGGLSGFRPPNPADVASQFQQVPQQNAREYLNMQQVRGNIATADMVSITPQSIQDLANKLAEREKAIATQHDKTDGNAPPRTLAQHQAQEEGGGGMEALQHRVQRGVGLAGQVMNEMGPGGSNVALGELAVQGMNWARRRFSQQAPGRGEPPVESNQPPGGLPPEGSSGMGSAPRGTAPSPVNEEAPVEEGAGALGGLGSIAKFLGPVAGVATAALSVFGLIQKGGETIQGMRNIAAVRGGAAGEGAEASMRARVLALNPFISQDQARQIFQAAMSEGYADASGGGADNVIDFMKTNLTTMNISVADSMKMLRATIIGSGRGDQEGVNGSIALLRQELDSIRTLSRGSVMSTPDYMNRVMGLQNQLMAQGVSPTQARNAAVLGTQVGAHDRILEGQFGEAEGALSGSVGGEAMLRLYGGYQLPQGLDPEAVSQYLGEEGELPQATENTLRVLARRASVRDRGGRVGHINAVRQFMRLLKTIPGAESMAATRDFGKAEALYRSSLGGQEFGQAQREVSDQGMGGGPDHTPPEGSGQLPSPAEGGGGGGGGLPAPGGGIIPGSEGWSGGGGGGGSGGGGGGAGNVTIDLTPQAARLLQVVGPNPAKLTPTQDGSNRGRSGYQVNAPSR